MRKEEIIGLIIDIFEDDLHNRDIARVSSKGTDVKFDNGIIPKHFLFDDNEGVFYGGEIYDNVAEKLEFLLKELKIIKE